MPSGMQISRDFMIEALLPQLKRALPHVYDRVATGVLGVGSDVLGLDDAISRDHHWGPRALILYARKEGDSIATPLNDFLQNTLRREFRGFEVSVNLTNLTGVSHCTIEDFFAEFLGTSELPRCDSDWLKFCEVDLLHVTAGEIVHDGPGEMTRRRDALAYYPPTIWKKRLADWCMYAAGRDAPYNLHRVSKRNDEITSTIYFGLCAKRLMELCFALNRQYAPYTKWLNQTYRRLPHFADQLAPLIDGAFATSNWNERVHLLVDASYVIADALAELNLTQRPERRKFDEQLTDLTLYHSAAQIYLTLPPELLRTSFNQIELWEKKSRDVLFDTNDYFQKR